MFVGRVYVMYLCDVCACCACMCALYNTATARPQQTLFLPGDHADPDFPIFRCVSCKNPPCGCVSVCMVCDCMRVWIFLNKYLSEYIYLSPLPSLRVTTITHASRWLVDFVVVVSVVRLHETRHADGADVVPYMRKPERCRRQGRRKEGRKEGEGEDELANKIPCRVHSAALASDNHIPFLPHHATCWNNKIIEEK